MFGIDNAETKRIEDRIDWITRCCVILFVKLGEWLHLDFPPPPK